MGNERLVVSCKARKIKKKSAEQLEILNEDIESVEASQSCRPTELCNAISQVAENSSLLGY